MRVGIATDHGGFGLKEELVSRIRAAGHEVADFGAHSLAEGDDDPDCVVPLGRAVVEGPEVAWDLVQTYLAAQYSRAERHLRRLSKVAAVEVRPNSSLRER